MIPSIRYRVYANKLCSLCKNRMSVTIIQTRMLLVQTLIMVVYLLGYPGREATTFRPHFIPPVPESNTIFLCRCQHKIVVGPVERAEYAQEGSELSRDTYGGLLVNLRNQD